MIQLTLSSFLQMQLALILLYGFYRLLLVQEQALQWNRVFLLLAMPLAALLGFLQITTKGSLAIPVALDSGALLQPLNALSHSTTAHAISIWQWLLYGYVAISAGLLLIMIARLLRMKIFVRKHIQEVKFIKGVPVYCLSENLPSFTFWHKVYWSQQSKLSEAENQAILRHELAHAQQHHSLDLVVMEILCALNWVNPIAWKLRNALRNTHEYLADAASAATYSVPAYQQLLAETYARQWNFGLSHYFYQSTLLNRITMLNRKNPIKIWKYVLLVPFMAALIFTFGCSQQQDEAVKLENPKTLSVQPAPMDGLQNYYQNISHYIKDHRDEYDLSANVSGIVYVKFTIMPDGSIQQVEAVKGLGEGYDKLATAAVTNAGEWAAGEKEGKKVATSRVLPIRFAAAE